MVNHPPAPPSDIQINGKSESSELSTGALGHVTLSAVVQDPVEHSACRLVAFVADNNNFHQQRYFRSDPVASGNRAKIVIGGLGSNKRWWAKCYTLDADGMRSDANAPDHGFNQTDWWMARVPNPPTMHLPLDNATIPTNLPLTFTWTFTDPDPGSNQNGFELRYRTSADSGENPGDWTTLSHPKAVAETITIAANTFSGTTNYDYQVRTQDTTDLWGPWTAIRSFFATGLTQPPLPVYPTDDRAVIVDVPFPFVWQFRSPISGAEQTNADIRYRQVGQDDGSWVTMVGDPDPGTPGSHQRWRVGGDVFTPDRHYDWEVRAKDDQGNPVSDWSGSRHFYSIPTPGGGNPPPGDGTGTSSDTLGIGVYRVFVFDRGGQVQRGEITDIASLQFARIRDDISHATVTITGWNVDCGSLLKTLRCWMHEIVIYRNGHRVWEGPITLLEFTATGVQIEAQDCMVYLYRRIMRQGYNDSYQEVDGVQVGLLHNTERAELIILNSLAPDDPNVLPYLSVFKYDTDAQESRNIPDYSQTAWEQIDSLASTAGLDYVVAGRRILVWDTHRPVGRLPQMTDGDFNNSIVVTEYGMQLSNYYAVSNGSGLWGATRPLDEPTPNAFYGPVELLSSAYGESASSTDTAEARDRAVDAMRQQATRNIAHRWPTPVQVRVPDNSTLSPDVVIGFDQLIPGVWIPVVSISTLREVSQWQKLNTVTVTVAGDQPEQIAVTMQPAPNGGMDPDEVDGLIEQAGG
jgi:hypothetical protein